MLRGLMTLRDDREVPTSLRPFGLGRLEARTEPSTAQLWVRGALIGASGLTYGSVVIDNGTITRLAAPDEPPPHDAQVIDTHGVVSPGFVDVHNHLSYAVLPRWTPSRAFRGRFDFRGKMRCGFIVNPNPDATYQERVVAPLFKLRQRHLPALIQYGLVRALVGGTTTALVDADLEDADLDSARYEGILTDPARHGPRILGLLDTPCLLGPALPAARVALRAGAKLFVHVGEGVDDVSVGEFKSLVEKRLLTENTVLVHGLALGAADWDAVRAAGAGAVLSPASNWNLYKVAPHVELLAGSGLPTALAPDWALSGSSTVLDELGFVRRAFPGMDAVQLLDMVTRAPADLMGRPDLGRIAPGARADLVVFGAAAPRDLREAARLVVEATVRDVRLVVVGGRPTFGEADLLSSFGGGEELTLEGPTGPLRRTLRMPGTTLGALQAVLHGAMESALPDGTIAPIWEQSPPLPPGASRLW